MKSNDFMLECMSICPETTWQKLKSHLPLFVCDVLSEDLHGCGFI